MTAIPSTKQQHQMSVATPDQKLYFHSQLKLEVSFQQQPQQMRGVKNHQLQHQQRALPVDILKKNQQQQQRCDAVSHKNARQQIENLNCFAKTFSCLIGKLCRLQFCLILLFVLFEESSRFFVSFHESNVLNGCCEKLRRQGFCLRSVPFDILAVAAAAAPAAANSNDGASENKFSSTAAAGSNEGTAEEETFFSPFWDTTSSISLTPAPQIPFAEAVSPLAAGGVETEDSFSEGDLYDMTGSEAEKGQEQNFESDDDEEIISMYSGSDDDDEEGMLFTFTEESLQNATGNEPFIMNALSADQHEKEREVEMVNDDSDDNNEVTYTENNDFEEKVKSLKTQYRQLRKSRSRASTRHHRETNSTINSLKKLFSPVAFHKALGKFGNAPDQQQKKKTVKNEQKENEGAAATDASANVAEVTESARLSSGWNELKKVIANFSEHASRTKRATTYLGDEMIIFQGKLDFHILFLVLNKTFGKKITTSARLAEYMRELYAKIEKVNEQCEQLPKLHSLITTSYKTLKEDFPDVDWFEYDAYIYSQNVPLTNQERRCAYSFQEAKYLLSRFIFWLSLKKDTKLGETLIRDAPDIIMSQAYDVTKSSIKKAESPFRGVNTLSASCPLYKALTDSSDRSLKGNTRAPHAEYLSSESTEPVFSLSSNSRERYDNVTIAPQQQLVNGADDRSGDSSKKRGAEEVADGSEARFSQRFRSITSPTKEKAKATRTASKLSSRLSSLKRKFESKRTSRKEGSDMLLDLMETRSEARSPEVPAIMDHVAPAARRAGELILKLARELRIIYDENRSRMCLLDVWLASLYEKLVPSKEVIRELTALSKIQKEVRFDMTSFVIALQSQRIEWSAIVDMAANQIANKSNTVEQNPQQQQISVSEQPPTQGDINTETNPLEQQNFDEATAVEQSQTQDDTTTIEPKPEKEQQNVDKTTAVEQRQILSNEITSADDSNKNEKYDEESEEDWRVAETQEALQSTAADLERALVTALYTSRALELLETRSELWRKSLIKVYEKKKAFTCCKTLATDSE